jgi:hypothetical protein
MARAMDAEAQLASFMAKYLPEIALQAKAARAAMRKRYPTALELVYDNYNALAIGYAPSEKTSEAIFLQAKGLPDPDRLLKGAGSVAKHIVLAEPAVLNDPAVKKLMQEAVARAKKPFGPGVEHQLIIKSISAKQRPRMPAK